MAFLDVLERSASKASHNVKRGIKKDVDDGD